jgi:hypothetical protein
VGVKQLSVVGEQFDPRLHEPVQQIETDEFPDNAVMHELRKGYTLNDKVIRPALVNVALSASASGEVKPTKTGELKASEDQGNVPDTLPVEPEKVLSDDKPPTVYDLGDLEQYDKPADIDE